MTSEKTFVIDVTENEIKIIADVPGFCSRDIRLCLSETTVSIDAENERRIFRQKIPLPVPAAPETAAAVCRTGVLEIVVSRLDC